MLACKFLKPLTLSLVFILLLTLWGYQLLDLQNNEYSQEKEIKIADHSYFFKKEDTESPETLDLDNLQEDLAMNLLGKSFEEIKKVLGKPDEQGYSSLYGPHNYMLFKHKEGDIRFGAPEDMENKTAVSIILKKGQTVLGAEVGMTFTEIEKIMGEPDFGPEPGMGNKFYMDYYFGKTTNQAPEVFISFSADTINSPTHDVFIKWEALEYDNFEMVHLVVP